MFKEIEYLYELNDIFCNHNLEAKYQFSYSECPGVFSFELEEIHYTGQTFNVFSSEDPLPEDIEEKYENNEMTYKEVIFEMIKRNINIHQANLSEVNDILFKIEEENNK